MRLCVLPVYTEDWFTGEAALRRALRTIETARQMADRHAAGVTLVTTAAELRETLDADRIALLLAFEGMEPVGADIDLIDTFWQLGVRMASLTWNRRTPFADGLGERSTGAGLTELGVKAVERMESLGLIVDVSHLADAGFDHVARVAARPFVASHSSCRDVFDHPRNLDDARLRAVAQSGGFVALNAMADFVGGERTLDAFLDHVEHAVELDRCRSRGARARLPRRYRGPLAARVRPAGAGHLHRRPRTPGRPAGLRGATERPSWSGCRRTGRGRNAHRSPRAPAAGLTYAERRANR